MNCNWLEALFAGWGAAETVASGALLVSVWASLSAHHSAQEAKRANAQAMYHERRAVFDAFLELSMHMQARGQAPVKEVVGRFYQHHHTAAFCFEKVLAKEIEDYFLAAFRLADYCSVNPGLPKLPPEQKAQYDFISARSLLLLEQVKKSVPVS